MKRTLITSAVTLVLANSAVSAATMTNSTFTMYDTSGALVEVPDTTITGSIGNGVWHVASTATFSGQTWTTHDGTTFGPGTYTFSTIQGGTSTGFVVSTGQIGGNILWDWGTVKDIDIAVVWDVVDNGDGTLTYVSTDFPGDTPPNPDGILGVSMLDGPFVGYSPNFDFTVTTVPIPSAV